MENGKLKVLFAPFFELALLDECGVLNDLDVAQSVEIGGEAYPDVVVGVTLTKLGCLDDSDPDSLGERVG